MSLNQDPVRFFERTFDCKKKVQMLNADERNERWLKVSIGLLRFE